MAPLRVALVSPEQRLQLEADPELTNPVGEQLTVRFHTIDQMRQWMVVNLPQDYSYALLYK